MLEESYFEDASGITPPSGAGGLFNGKELQTFADLYLYDYHWRQYDPQLGRWHSTDPADQFYGISGYAYCGNNPVMNIDPDGRELVTALIVGAIIAGGINLGVKAYQGKINSWGDGFAAFGIGAAAGAAAVLTGGAALSAVIGMSFAATFTAAGVGAGGFLAGAASGAAGAAASSLVQGFGNMGYFGDPYSVENFATDVAFGAAFGGVTNGIASGIKGNNFWTGVPRSSGGNVFSINDTKKAIAEGWQRMSTKKGTMWGRVEAQDLTFDNVLNPSQGHNSSSIGGLNSGDVHYAIGQVQGKLSLYPQVIDIRTGGLIRMPSVGGVIPKNMRVAWDGRLDRNTYIREWYNRGYSTPRGGWEHYDIHHILPREYGGGNNFWNLVPVERRTHQTLFNRFWQQFGGL